MSDRVGDGQAGKRTCQHEVNAADLATLGATRCYLCNTIITENGEELRDAD